MLHYICHPTFFVKIVKTHAMLLPLHSLIVQCSPTFDRTKFSSHEIITLEQISFEIVGSYRPDLIKLLQPEMTRRIMLKLSLGERVILCGWELDRQYRLAVVSKAIQCGANVQYIRLDNECDLNLRNGDGLTKCHHIVQQEEDNIVVVQPYDDRIDLATLFKGITVIADIHGMITPFRDAIRWAANRQHFVWVLGDAIDYGDESLLVMEEIYHRVMHGLAAFSLGNHERKIARWIALMDDPDSQAGINLSEGNRKTTRAIKQLSDHERHQWVGRFKALLAKSSLIGSVANVTFVHAAIHPCYWKPDSITTNEGISLENFALYGEVNRYNGSYPPDYKLMSYDWVEAVPDGETVIVGHDRRASVPMIVTNKKGGVVVFLDTGSGKNGKLSTTDLRFVSNDPKQHRRLKIECFNVHD